MSEYVYTGPFVRCLVQRREQTEERQACTNTVCLNHTQHLESPFCPRCGAPQGAVTYIVMVDAVDDHAVHQAIHEELWMVVGDLYQAGVGPHGAHLWIANDGTVGRELDAGVETLLDVTPDLMRQEMQVFETMFADALVTLRQWYGEAAVSVRWGVIGYSI